LRKLVDVISDTDVGCVVSKGGGVRGLRSSSENGGVDPCEFPDAVSLDKGRSSRVTSGKSAFIRGVIISSTRVGEIREERDFGCSNTTGPRSGTTTAKPREDRRDFIESPAEVSRVSPFVDLKSVSVYGIGSEGVVIGALDTAAPSRLDNFFPNGGSL